MIDVIGYSSADNRRRHHPSEVLKQVEIPAISVHYLRFSERRTNCTPVFFVNFGEKHVNLSPKQAV